MSQVNFIELTNKYGYDEGAIGRFAELAALKAMPVFRAFGLEYGDQVPGLYKLVEDLTENIGKVLGAEGETKIQTGWFIIDKYEDYEPGVYAIQINLALEEMNTAQLRG
jgi:hypothetical protein